MKEQLLNLIASHGDRAGFIPVSILSELQQEMQELSQKYSLNDYQMYLINEHFTYDIPDLGFPIKSILMVASPSPLMKVAFNYNGRKLTYRMPSTYYDYNKAPSRTESYLKEFLNTNQIHIASAGKLPYKYLSAKSGLTRYGRNNICFAEGLGCNIALYPFFTDIECEAAESYIARNMDACTTCNECVKHCPTAAIQEDRFLIDNKRCLTYMNEAGAEAPFPDWVSPSAHNAIIGCTICQEVCPQNKKFMKNIVDSVEFDENETLLLLKELSEEETPGYLKDKLAEINMLGYRYSLPRNLKALLEKET